MKQIAGRICGVLALAALVAGCSSTQRSGTGTSTGTFQLRLVQEAPAKEATAMRMLHKQPDGTRPKLYVQNHVLLDQTALKSAALRRDSFGYPEVVVTFTEDGAKRLADITQQSIGRRLAIVIDGQLYTAPELRGQITTGTAVISNNFTDQEADQLLARINAALKR